MASEYTTRIAKKDGEFRVRLFKGGRHVVDADYFTSDKTDAEVTANAMVKTAVANELATERVEADYHRKTYPE